MTSMYTIKISASSGTNTVSEIECTFLESDMILLELCMPKTLSSKSYQTTVAGEVAPRVKSQLLLDRLPQQQKCCCFLATKAVD